MDHISTDAASVRHPALPLRHRRHTALRNTEAHGGVTRHRSPHHEIPAQAGGYLSVSPRVGGAHGAGLLSGDPHPRSERRREQW